MPFKLLALCLGIAALFVTATPNKAEPRLKPANRSISLTDPEWSAQARTKRPRTRIHVRYGRLLYRDCTVRYVQEWRPSGAVIVPDMRCWWVRN